MDSRSVTAGTSPTLWDDDLWEELLGYIEDRSVIPIVGPSSFQVESGGRRMTVDRYVAERLAAKYNLETAEDSALSLNSVVARFLRQPGKRREPLYGAIKAIVQEANFKIPEALTQLASITHFNLFVTTSFDPLLEGAINLARFKGEPRTEAVVYTLKDPRDIAIIERPTVYYLLGRMANAPQYAISDDDLLEFVFSLQGEDVRAKNLFDALRDNNLLFIGGSFPDWLIRFFLRTLKGQPLSDRRDVLEILADDHSAKDNSLTHYLASFSTRTKVFAGGAPEFVAELFRRWRERFPRQEAGGEATPVPLPRAEMPTRAVFISYARQDLEAVHEIARRLHAAGVEFWFDLSTEGSPAQRLTAGDDWNRKIRDNIRRCSLFLAVLSANTESRVEGYFHREWNYARDRRASIAEGIPFIFPVVIDNTAAFRLIPDAFRAAHTSWIPAGALDDTFVTTLKAAMNAR